PFDDIFSFRKRVFDDRNIRSPQKRIGKVDYHISWLEPDKPGNLLDFINGRFDMKFVEGLDLEKAKLYIYNDDFGNLYENNGNQNFSVYNRYWQSELPNSIVILKNLDSLNQKLCEKIIQQFNLEVEISKKRTTEDPQIESSTKKI
ncbi:11852_t:CDS:2, partial [Dentiscutata erythropus]